MEQIKKNTFNPSAMRFLWISYLILHKHKDEGFHKQEQGASDLTNW